MQVLMCSHLSSVLNVTEEPRWLLGVCYEHRSSAATKNSQHSHLQRADDQESLDFFLRKISTGLLALGCALAPLLSQTCPVGLELLGPWGLCSHPKAPCHNDVG